MKRIQLILMACTALLVSCEDFLTRLPQASLTPETYFTSEKECELYTNDFYTIFPGSGIYSETADYIITDNLDNEVIGNRIPGATDGNWNWDKLRDINFFLAHSHQCADESVRAKYEGYARFFRAYFYYEKVKRFGDVPWLDSPLDASDPALFNTPRTDRKTVMANVLADIDFAIANLPSKKDVYKVTKWTALALKSRIFLFEGTFRKYHNLGDWEDCLKEAAKAAEEFVTSSGYTLYKTGSTPYRDLFVMLDSDQSEVILTRCYTSGLTLTHNATQTFTSTTMGLRGIAKDVVNMYLMKDGTRFTDKAGYETMNFVQETENRDPRLAQTVRTPGYVRVGSNQKEAPNMAATITGYQIIKYVCEKKFDAYDSSENDLPIFRTAEVYLNLAEAKAELGTLTQNDLDLTVNKLRERAGMTGMLNMADANANPDKYLSDPVTGYTGVEGANAGVILEIRRERTVELMAEGFRYWDIMRWKAGKRFERPFYGMCFPEGAKEYNLDGDSSTGHNGIDFVLYSGSAPTDQKAGVVYMSLTRANLSREGYITCHSETPRKWTEDRDYLYPIPTDDIILTGGVIKQNPNWNDGLNF